MSVVMTVRVTVGMTEDKNIVSLLVIVNNQNHG